MRQRGEPPNSAKTVVSGLAPEILDVAFRFLDLDGEPFDIDLAAYSALTHEAAVLDNRVQGLVRLLSARRTSQGYS